MDLKHRQPNPPHPNNLTLQPGAIGEASPSPSFENQPVSFRCIRVSLFLGALSTVPRRTNGTGRKTCRGTFGVEGLGSVSRKRHYVGGHIIAHTLKPFQ